MGKFKIGRSVSEIRAKNVAKANKSGFLKKKFSLFLYVVILLLAVGARTYQLLTNMDFDTGRYRDSSLMLNYPLMVLVPGIILLAFVLLAGSAKDTVLGSVILINPMRLRYDRLNKKIPHAAGYMSLTMVLLIIVQIVLDFVNIVHTNEKIRDTLPLDEQDYYNMLTGYTVGKVIMHVLMIFVILTFLSIAINIFKGEGLSHANCAALSTFAIWKTWELVDMLIENSMVGCYSEMVYRMLSYMTAVIFFMNTARFFNGMEKKYTRFWMCFMGYTSSILAAVSVLPRYLLLLINIDYDSRENMSLPEISDIGIIVMTITIVAVFWTTYVYRVMPKLNLGKRRWSRMPEGREELDIEKIEVQEVTDEAIKNSGT